MGTIADYFIAAFKQYANLVNNDSARRYAIVITAVIGEAMSDKKREVYFTHLPAGLAPSKQRFYLKLIDWQPKYDKLDAKARIAKRLALNDETEVETIIKAYFRAIKELIEPTTRMRLSYLMPDDFVRLYTQA